MTTPQPYRQRTVRIVEDGDSAELLTAGLHRLDYHVTRARTGEDALRTIQHSPVDAVIVDLLLPGMTGWQLIEELHSIKPARRCPIVVCSVLDRHDYPTNIDAALPKPYTRHQLEHVMHPPLTP